MQQAPVHAAVAPQAAPAVAPSANPNGPTLENVMRQARFAQEQHHALMQYPPSAERTAKENEIRNYMRQLEVLYEKLLQQQAQQQHQAQQQRQQQALYSQQQRQQQLQQLQQLQQQLGGGPLPPDAAAQLASLLSSAGGQQQQQQPPPPQQQAAAGEQGQAAPPQKGEGSAPEPPPKPPHVLVRTPIPDNPGSLPEQIHRQRALNATHVQHFAPATSAARSVTARGGADEGSLSAAALRTYEALLPPESDMAVRQELMDRLQAHVKRVEPDGTLYPFGSSVSGLASKGADLDLTIMTSASGVGAEMPMERQRELVEELAEALEASGEMEEVQARPKARVPIVALKDKLSGLKSDICMCNTLALANSRLLRAYMQIDPRARQLALVVKHWAKRRSINNPYHGSPSSYAWVLLSIHYLQTVGVLPVLQMLFGPDVDRGPATILKTHDGRDFDCAYCGDAALVREAMAELGPPNPASLGELLIGFFRRYAREFDFVKSVVCVRTGTFVTKTAKGWDKKEAGFKGDRHLFCIEDPFELTHDLGRVMDRDTLRDVRSEIDRADVLLSEQRGTFEKLCEKYEGAPSQKSKPKPPPPPPPPLNADAAFPALPGFGAQ